MRLNLVPARTGLSWVKLGAKTFWRQPLALAGLFFMFMAVVSLLQLVPVLGMALAAALVPAATLGLMAATREAEAGRFPMPIVLATAFRGSSEQRKAMAMLGAMYAAALFAVISLSLLLADPAPAAPSASSDAATVLMRETLSQPGLWMAMLLYTPVLMAFWHAPVLVYWHGVRPVKSLFFSLLACWANKWALLVYTLGWAAVFLVVGLTLGVLAAVVGSPQVLSMLAYPLVLIMAAMFHTSVWFTVRDSFQEMAQESAGNPSAGQ
jgi:hypothetical protein